ncbi:MAG: hypothetical protein ABI968_14825, partial [Acidobacteriota bacterium]
YAVIHPGASLLPWTLWALARPAGRPIGRVFPMALVYGLMLLAGDAFSLALALMSAALWIGLELPRRERLPRILQAMAGLGIGVLIALPQVLATALVAPETRRAVSGFTLGDAALFTIPFARLIEFVVPYPFGPSWSLDHSLDWGNAAFRRFFVTLFVGPIALVGLFAARPHGARSGTRFARWLVCLSAALAVCGHFLPVAWAALPSPIPLRFPEKFILGTVLGLAIAAGIAVDALRAGRARPTPFLVVATILSAASILAVLGPGAVASLGMAAVDAPGRVNGIAASQIPSALADGGLLWIATAIAAALLSHGGRIRVVGALALLTAIPVVADRPIANDANEADIFAPTPYARRLIQKDPRGRYRTLDESIYRETSLLEESQRADVYQNDLFRQSWFLSTHSLWGRGTILNADFDVGDLSRVESLRRLGGLAAGQADSSAFFESLGLRYGIRFRDQEPVAGFRPFGGDTFRRWDENPRALPHIRLVESWRETSGPVEALAALPRLDPGQVVIETDRRASGSARPGHVDILTETPESLLLMTDCPDPAWLFVLRGDWSYRTVRIDGRPAPTFPAQIAFTAIALPAGAHRVEWREVAPGLEVSRWGPVAGALLLLGVARARRSP